MAPFVRWRRSNGKKRVSNVFCSVPNGTVWSNHTQDHGYDLVLLGQATPKPIDVDALQNRFEQPDYKNVVLSLRSVGFRSALDVLSTYFGQASDLEPWLQGAQLNLDTNLRLQYLAGFEINADASADLWRSLAAYRRFPEGLFKGSDGFMEALRSLITHCQSPEAGSYTPADFPHARLSQADLDKLFATLSHTGREHRHGRKER